MKKIIKDYGVIGGYGRIRQRLNDCQLAYSKLADEHKKDKKRKKPNSENKWYDCCAPSAACEAGRCMPKKEPA